MTWDAQYRLPPQIGQPVPPRRVVGSTPLPAARKPVCGTTCHRHGRWGGLTSLTACAAVGAFVLAVIVWNLPHHTSQPVAPGSGGGSTSQIYPHNPAYGAAVIAGEAKGAARVAGSVARWGFRGVMLGRRGGFTMPGTGGFHGYGPGIFGGF